MTVPFTRRLGARSGVQLNYRLDNTEGLSGGNVDQVSAFAIKCQRGNIDSAFRVNRGNYKLMLGEAGSVAANQLNEGYVQVYEFFSGGGSEAIISRLITDAAVNSLIVCDAAAVTAAAVWTTATVAPGTETLTIKHKQCFSDGVNVSINAAAAYASDGVTPVASKEISLVITDSSGNELLNVAGSLDPLAKDDAGKSRFITDLVAQFYSQFVVTVPTNASVPTTSLVYGKDANSSPKTVSEQVIYFSEGGSGYSESDYDDAIERLRRSEFDFGYIGSAGSTSPSLITKLLLLGKELNKPTAWDVPGNLSPTAAMAFYNSVGGTDSEYSHCYWSPLKHTDPVSGGKSHIGKSGMQLGFRCQRNSQTNNFGLAPKQYPIAGKSWPLIASGIEQTYTPDEPELDSLAELRINPVISVKYRSGSRYVFSDSLTGSKTESIKKLTSVADMSCQIDDDIAGYANESLQLPMSESIRNLQRFMQAYFEAAEASGWLVPSEELDGRSFVGQVVRNAQRPDDRMDVSYAVRYDGTTRAIYVTQTYSR